MARSRKRTPIIGNTCAESEKQDKQLANRCVRRGQWHLTLRDVSNTWAFAKDGKHYMRNVKPEYMRK